MAAVLSARTPACVSHRSAAYLHGLEGCGMPAIGTSCGREPSHGESARRMGLLLEGAGLPAPV